MLLAKTREDLQAKPEEKIDKRYRAKVARGWQYLAPNNQYYVAHCGFCAEVKYLEDIYKDSPRRALL